MERVLSGVTPVRALRGRAVSVTGQIRYRAGSTEPISAAALITGREGALRLLWLAALLIGESVLVARWL